MRAWALVDDQDYEWAMQWRWSVGSAGYTQRTVYTGSRRGPAPLPKVIVVSLHRALAERMGIADAPQIDHRNRDKLDCRRSNLRRADAKLNAQNRPKGRGPAPTRFGCTEVGCTDKHFAKGKCKRHWFRDYQRARRAKQAAA